MSDRCSYCDDDVDPLRPSLHEMEDCRDNLVVRLRGTDAENDRLLVAVVDAKVGLDHLAGGGTETYAKAVLISLKLLLAPIDVSWTRVNKARSALAAQPAVRCR